MFTYNYFNTGFEKCNNILLIFLLSMKEEHEFLDELRREKKQNEGKNQGFIFLPSLLWSQHRSTGLCPYRHSPRRRERERVLYKNSLASPDWLGRSKHSFLFLEPQTLTISGHVTLRQRISKNRAGKGEAVVYRRTVRWVHTIYTVFEDFKKCMHGKRS